MQAICSIVMNNAISDKRDPLIALLEAAKMMGGQERQAECDILIERIHSRPISYSIAATHRRSRIVMGIAMLLLVCAGIMLLWHYHNRIPQQPERTEQQADISETHSAPPSLIQKNITTLPPVIHNFATTEEAQSPAIVGDHNTINY